MMFLIFVIVLNITGDVDVVIDWANSITGRDLSGFTYFVVGWFIAITFEALIVRGGKYNA